MSFHGSYCPDDVDFLLTPLPATAVENPPDKERLIQSGLRHYSAFLAPERPPSAAYKALFFEAHAQNKARMARDCVRLARHIAKTHPSPTLLSLARAGTPIGVILVRLLREMGYQARHFSLSIIRDKGLDAQAMDTVLAQHPACSLFFIDGWTGKGVIAQTLHESLEAYNTARGRTNDPVLPRLCVLSDLAGVAWCAAGLDDYLIPSSILNAVVSGLISRTVLNEAIGPQDYHGCVYYPELAPDDVSLWLVKTIVHEALPLLAQECAACFLHDREADRRAQAYADFIRREMAHYGLTDRNRIKPGIGEATRVLLRRLPDRLILKNPASPDVAHLLALAKEKHVPIDIRPDLPLLAMALIRSALDA